MNYLTIIGGRNAKDCIVRMMQKVFANSVAKDCSWLGQRDNYKVCDLTMMKIIRGMLFLI